MNLKVLFAVLAVALVAIIALNWILLVAMSRTAACENPDTEDEISEMWEQRDHKKMFADLSSQELMQVVRYLKHNLAVTLVNCTQALPSDNFIYMVELQLPRKADALRFLDQGGDAPNREARAVVVFGAQSKPNITEYTVGPLPTPTYHVDVTSRNYNSLHFNSRPTTLLEYKTIRSIMGLEKVSELLRESYGSDWKVVIPLDSAPRGFKLGDRETWFPFTKNLSGTFLHPLGFNVLVDHSSTNISEWGVKQVFYNGQYFGSIEELVAQYNKGTVQKTNLQGKDSDPNYASLKPRKQFQSFGPFQHEPQGQRYRVLNNHVSYFDWELAFRHSAASGLQLFDIRFKKERLVYELSIQELSSVYGGETPALMRTKFLDRHYGIGTSSNELVKGVDCPYTATFVDTLHFMGTDEPQRIINSICIFEQNRAIPLRRHYSSWYSPLSYGGLLDNVLIIRSVTTAGNYDYIFDFVFHNNGVIETKVFPSGYALTSFISEEKTNYGAKLEENVLGNIHTHFLHFKADLDIMGTSNSFETKDIEYQLKSVPWKTDQKVHVPTVKRRILETENEAAFRTGMKMPSYLNFVNLAQKNKWGHPRGYRIQVVSFNPESVPEDSPDEKGISWQRYQLAVTKHKDQEQKSSSIYHQNSMWKPPVYFDEFINGESIKNEDLVAWITAGFLHIPHAEDVPNTATPGNGVGFFLKPLNYFNNDPSVYSPDAVYIDLTKETDGCEDNPMACMSEVASCIPNLPDFTYGKDVKY
ncbi:membrane primary amine oxidase-like isoform X2 [Pristis pectinata]|uniref:membrane primary amine oxidase-like isoform X1 n=1 Tax=Pristis pectinata TaxID=685728 RepID=UPI00223E1F0B|nr:membrane primary amine oxidase-like isoform X1 [Pristis pectinata]XP_051894682.1 membrane primary amine oxidase-like isoform X2 [Pristis pectinata]